MAHSIAAHACEQPSSLDPNTLAECRSFDQIPLVLLEPLETDDHCPTHPFLEQLADSVKGKHQTPIRYELRLAYRRFLKNGHFMINQKLFDFIHSSKCRIKFLSVLSRISEIRDGHVLNRRSLKRVFTHPTLIQKGTTYNGSRLSGSPGWVVSLPIPCGWLVCRYHRWSAYCLKHDLPQRMDIDDSTEWGSAIRESHRRMTLPANLPEGTKKEVVARHRSLTKNGVLNIAVLRHGRMSHATTTQSTPA